MKKDFASTLKELRLNAGYSQKQVYEMLGIPQSTFSSWEIGKAEPSASMTLKLCKLYHVDDILTAFGYDGYNEDGSIQLNLEEIKHIEKYRSLDPHGKEIVDFVLTKESERMTELETSQSTVIDIQPRLENNTRFIEYHRSASAGTGVFILGNEGVDQLSIPDTPENRKVDYAIKVSGNSMEPDYYDGDIVLVSQKVELNHGDVGIFIINNDAYIKEYGETELISRNPDADNILISEYDNIVCMGKVVGKYEE